MKIKRGLKLLAWLCVVGAAVSCLILLAKSGADSLLKDAASRGDARVAQICLLVCNAKLPDPEYIPPLCTAARAGHLEIVKLLVQHGADVNGSGGPKPLVSACYGGHHEVAKFLLQQGADANAEACYGNGTPLQSAEFNPEMIALLVSYCAKQ
ncbi:MAG: ankyrin repeat domain-containing protein [Verrucomicrobia bacterium]|nr:ankyrin repeat domain-containing protein [Verrucomicrobiota bacterium]